MTAGRRRVRHVPTGCGQVTVNRRRYNTLFTIDIGSNTYCVVEEFPPGLAVAPMYKAIQTTHSLVGIRTRPRESKHKLVALQKVFHAAHRMSGYMPRTVDYGWSDTHEYLVVEWIEGRPLEQYISRQAPGKPYFTAVDSYRLVRSLAYSLQRLHRVGIVHGDLKPLNLVLPGPERMQLLPIDFGSSWFGLRGISRERASTRGYAAPEQWRNADFVDRRTDQFAASVILYRLLTGDLPYEGLGGQAGNAGAPMKLVAPSRRNSEVWSDLDRVVKRGLALDAADRYPSTDDWVSELNSARPRDQRPRGSAWW